MDKTKDHIALITVPVDEKWLPRLQAQVEASGLQIMAYPTNKIHEIPDEIWQRVEILFTLWFLPAPEKVPNLRWVQLYTAGDDLFHNHPIYLDKEVIFTTASGIHSVNIAEYTFTMMLTWYHRLPRLLDYRQRKIWPPNQESQQTLQIEELRGKTIGIVGYGSIGREVARLAHTFGMRVLALQRSSDHRDHGFLFPDIGDPEGTIPERYYNQSQLYDLLGESDVVVIGVPLTKQTRHLFDERAFQAMKKSAFLINIARGEVCDQEALIKALREEQIAGAAIDVATPEPLPPDSLLWDLPNIFISPHVSGLTPQYSERGLTIFEANLLRYLAGQPLYNLVDREQ